MILHVGVGCTNEIGLVIALVIAVGIGEILAPLKIAGTVAAVFIGLGRVGNFGCIECAVMNPAALHGGVQNAFTKFTRLKPSNSNGSPAIAPPSIAPTKKAIIIIAPQKNPTKVFEST